MSMDEREAEIRSTLQQVLTKLDTFSLQMAEWRTDLGYLKEAVGGQKALSDKINLLEQELALMKQTWNQWRDTQKSQSIVNRWLIGTVLFILVGGIPLLIFVLQHIKWS